MQICKLHHCKNLTCETKKFIFYKFIKFKPVWRLENRSGVRGFRGYGDSMILESYEVRSAVVSFAKSCQ